MVIFDRDGAEIVLVFRANGDPEKKTIDQIPEIRGRVSGIAAIRLLKLFQEIRG